MGHLQREGVEEEAQAVGAHGVVGGGEAPEEDGLIEAQQQGIHRPVGLLGVEAVQHPPQGCVQAWGACGNAQLHQPLHDTTEWLPT